MPAPHHKNGPSGPSKHDTFYRLYFESDEAYLDAMETARRLEKKKMFRRAWRVRLNLDNMQLGEERCKKTA